MLRVQTHQDEEEDGEQAFMAVDVMGPQSPAQEQEKEQTDEQFLWLLLLAAVAECVTTCFAWNVGGTALNWLGPFLDGVTYGYEDRLKSEGVSIACVQFRSAFLGVFTSYSFMVDHAGDLSGDSFVAGPMYVCASVLGGCVCFWMGKQAAAWVNLMTSRVADGEELVLGILMSCSAVLLSNYLCELFPRQPSQLRTAASPNGGPFIDWGCLSCNLIASVLAGLTYQLSRVSPTGTNNLLALKFVSSFCGSLSVFSGAVSIISRLWLAGNRHSALWNLSLQLLAGLLCIPYLYKHEAT
uniref:Uncharacterized protein n=1 Tax=Phytophthora ramorum TaxID=164328 RepID=H3GMW8_PHYRM